MSELQKVEKDVVPAAPTETAAIMNVIERAASDPNVDIDKMERLMAMHERMVNKQAEIAFSKALSDMQNNLPEITEGGQIKHGDKIISQYARWDEDINPVIKPILYEYGFSLSFRTDTKDGVNVEAVLSHAQGHSERTSIKLPADSSGSKNAVQAVASSVSYGKRYTAGALLNLTTKGQDDDGVSAYGPERIDDDQEANILALIEEVGANKQQFCRYFKINDVADLSVNAYPDAIRMLEQKRKQA